MKTFPEGIQFRYPWRKYQQRVFDNLEEHLQDHHLHIVAPPGSGKTVLGLEVAIRLNKPMLILAPTLAIKNQWIQRFCELFFQTHQRPDWITSDIRQPAFMTVTTYQALHAAYNHLQSKDDSFEEEDDSFEEEDGNEYNDETCSQNAHLNKIAEGLQAVGIQTIIADEAHHLKSEWWCTLTMLKSRLRPVVVGLTATPPYDVTASEWNRYLELNGPVDAEISIRNWCRKATYVPTRIMFTLRIPR